jgi:heme oxygenase
MAQLFTALKQGTHACHNALENTYPFSIYHERDSFDIAAYQDVLCVMRCFHQCVAQSLSNAAVSNSLINALLKHIDLSNVLSAIDTDLALLEEDNNGPKNTNNTALASLEATAQSPCSTAYDDTSHCIAGLYVWLGSSMGANILIRRLSEMSTPPPTHYYKAMAECARSWVGFKQHVDSIMPPLLRGNSDIVTHIVEDANHWFNYLITIGSQRLPTSETVFAAES